MIQKELPEIIVIAGPNGSGKSTLTRLINIRQPYINADEIKKTTMCSDLEAAKAATALRQKQIEAHKGFTFETVMSSKYALNQLWSAKEKGFFIRGFYIFPKDVKYNLQRVLSRENSGGHPVPENKIVERYEKSLLNLPEFISVCDICNIYDNTTKEPFRIFKKQKDLYFYWENENWTKDKITQLTGHTDIQIRTE